MSKFRFSTVQLIFILLGTPKHAAIEVGASHWAETLDPTVDNV